MLSLCPAVVIMSLLMVASTRPDASDLQDALNAILTEEETTVPIKGNICCFIFVLFWILMSLNLFLFCLWKEFPLFWKYFPIFQTPRPSYLSNPLTPTFFVGPADEDDMIVLGDGSHTLDLHTVPADSGPDYAAIMWSACALLGLMTCLTVCVCGIRVSRRWARPQMIPFNQSVLLPPVLRNCASDVLPAKASKVSCFPIDGGGKFVQG